MKRKRREAGLHPALWTVILFAFIIGSIVLTLGQFNRDFRPYARVTLTSDRSGLVMEPGAKVKLRGVQVGRVASIQPGDPVKLRLELYPEQLKYIPANVGAKITATTAFGAKYVDLLTPADPSPRRLTAGAVVESRNVSTEVNTVFQNLVAVLNQIDVAKLNAVLTALADGFRGKGEAIGEATTDLNEVLMAINPRSETIRADYRALKGFSDTYSAAARNIVTVLDAASTTSTTITDNAKQLDSLLLNVIGLSRSGINLIGPEQGQPGARHQPARVHHAPADEVQPGTHLPAGRREERHRFRLLRRCRRSQRIFGDPGRRSAFGRRRVPVPGQSADQRRQGWPRRPARLRIVARRFEELAAALPGHQHRVGHRAGHAAQPRYRLPGICRLLPRHPRDARTAEHSPPGGPGARSDPGTGYSGTPPYGAPQYAPDGTPLYPGLPPAPPPGRPREPGPPPAGSEPFVPAAPGVGPQPTCGIINQQCVPPPLPPYAPAP